MSPRRCTPSSLPSALTALPEITARAREERKRLAFFLDYDGTLSPIVDDPDKAILPPRTRDALQVLAQRHATAIVSGRGLQRVRDLVGLDNVVYAGSHGFEIVGNGLRHYVAEDWRGRLNMAKEELSQLMPQFEGSLVEDNNMAVAFHYRKVDKDQVSVMSDCVSTVADKFGLKRKEGKMVFELRPALEWHKGKAVEYLLERMGGGFPICIGDDLTDEDAFETVRESGVGIVVGEGGGGGTFAKFRLQNPEEVRVFLLSFAKGTEEVDEKGDCCGSRIATLN